MGKKNQSILTVSKFELNHIVNGNLKNSLTYFENIVRYYKNVKKKNL